MTTDYISYFLYMYAVHVNLSTGSRDDESTVLLAGAKHVRRFPAAGVSSATRWRVSSFSSGTGSALYPTGSEILVVFDEIRILESNIYF
jgi:hypothetical protein